ncbi:uncharacterized protein LOC123536359 isoform X2 [Mercenaria mercenaria]|nr:uncharacterized protein LOC123536359 isoform X2 [Mercenaria mercenaria]
MEIINVENIILENLARKVEDPDPNRIVPMIQSLLKQEESFLRLDAVLRMVSRALKEHDKSKFFIVDLMPNLKWMLNNPMFIKECAEEFRVFEEQFPISFAIHFVIPKEKVINKLQVECAKHPTTQKDPKKPDAPKQSDEADSSRTQKRVILYQNSIKHFMDYFTSKDNIVTVDVSCGLPQVIWSKVCDFFSQFDFQSTSIPESVVIFGFDQKDLDEIQIGNYSLTVIKLKDLVQESNATVEVLLDEISRFVDNSDPTGQVYAVDGSDTALIKDLKKVKTKRTIQFHESGNDCRLGRYCSVNVTTKGDPVDLQAVSSLQNEVCLFPKTVSPDLCKWIAVTMGECRMKQKKSR